MGKTTISMAIFNSYVKLPEGIWMVYAHGIAHGIPFCASWWWVQKASRWWSGSGVCRLCVNRWRMAICSACVMKKKATVAATAQEAWHGLALQKLGAGFDVIVCWNLSHVLYGICSNIYIYIYTHPKNHPNVGKNVRHGAYIGASTNTQ